MRLLVPVDFSSDSLNALRYATALASLVQSKESSEIELLIFHALHLPIGGDATFFVDAEMLEREEQHLKHKLYQEVNTIPEIHTIPHQVITKIDMAPQGITQILKEEHIDLVIMGVKGKDESSSSWFGSTTLHVMRHAHCPVLAVPPNTEVFHPRHVALASDLKMGKETFSLEYLKKLIQLWQADLHIIHVHPHPAKIGIEPAEEAMHLDHFFHDVPHTYHFPEDKDPGRGLNHYLQAHPVDLLAIIPRYHFALDSLFHKSITKYMSTHTSIPLLAIHEKLASGYLI
ncbi:universal stress protein [Catalinimonas niigatensis]|uniref:universal stress protein n=1 Tax=Catalinimonas niigatensis TaxID=1397264 RepID=UPI0026658878|nr:universal stress protein [Catalinimonas niigatensis]WPP49788.1 universal stress protein [Catalinimonas niigatensis]